MPPAAIIGAAVIGGGASYLASKNASSKAAGAAKYAADQNAAVNREIYQQTRADLSPYNQAGGTALSALMQRLGLTPMSAPGAQTTPAAPQTTPAVTIGAREAALGPSAKAGGLVGDVAGQVAGAVNTQAPSGVDYQRLFADRPDVKAEYDRLSATADPNSPWFSEHGLDRGPEGFADWWSQNKPATDTYQVPMAGQPATNAPADPNAPAPTYFQETYDARPADVAAPTFSRQPDRAAPAAPTVDWQSIANDPGFKFETDETARGVNANFSARSMLRSGGAAKALQDRLFGVAHKYGSDYFNRSLNLYDRASDQYRYGQDRDDRNFVDDRSYGTNLWNTQQARRDNLFSEDRGFAANRNDTATGNLFNLVGVGQSAAAGTAAAGQNYARGMTDSNNARASATANAAIANGANVTNLFGSAANAVGTYYGMKGRI